MMKSAKSPLVLSPVSPQPQLMSAPVSPTPLSNNHSSANQVSATPNRTIIGLLDKYQKDRLQFVQNIADLACRESNVESLIQSGTMTLLKPLLQDPVPSIQQSAAVAIGRLANYNHSVASTVVKSDILPRLVSSLHDQNRFYKKAAAFVVRAIAKHSAELAQAVVDAGALKSLVHCLEEFDPTVKESACWALGYIAKHNADLAQAVVDAGTISQLLLCLQEPELPLKRIAASTLADLCRHTSDLAQSVVDANAIQIMASFIHGPASKSQTGPGKDVKLMKQVIGCLSQISKHSLPLAEAVVDGDIFPHVYKYFKAPEIVLRRACAELISEIVKHAPALAQLVAQTGGIAVAVDYISSLSGAARVPGIMIIGYASSMNEILAMSVINSNGVQPLSDALGTGKALDENGEVDYSKSAACWALGQIAKYSPEHAKHLTSKAILPKLLKIYVKTVQKDILTADEQDLKGKAKRALKSTLGNTLDVTALDPLLQTDTPPVVLKYILVQYAKILPNDVAARKFMVTSGALARIQTIATQYKNKDSVATSPVAETASESDATKELYAAAKMSDSIRKINSCFPEEIVRYYSPGYSTTLLSKIDEYATSKAQVKTPSLSDLKSKAPKTLSREVMSSLPMTIPEDNEKPQTSTEEFLTA